MDDEDVVIYLFFLREQEYLNICLDNVLLFFEESNFLEELIDEVKNELVIIKKELFMLIKVKVMKVILIVLVKIYKESVLIVSKIYFNVKEFVIK